MAEGKGSVTEKYKADVKKVIEKLNIARSTEIIAWLQYKHHSYMAVSLHMEDLQEIFDEHAAQELEHADKLAVRIQQLNGVPVLTPHVIENLAKKEGYEARQAENQIEMVKLNLKDERGAVMFYTDIVRILQFDDPTTRKLIEDILADEEHHANELQNLLDTKADVDKNA